MKRKVVIEAVQVITPGEDWKSWRLGFYQFPNKSALRIARFIAKWNGYRLVKEPKEVK